MLTNNNVSSNWYLELFLFSKNLFGLKADDSSAYTQWPDLPVIVFDVNYFSFLDGYYQYAPFFILSAVSTLFAINTYILSSNSNVFITSLLSFGEKEVNAIDDLLVAIFLFVVFFFFNFFGGLHFTHSYSLSLGLVMLFFYMCMLLVSVPFVMLYNFGFYFVINIRGGATTLSCFYDLSLDFVNLLSFVLRLCIQLVRIIVIGVTYQMYNHLFLEYQYMIVSISWSELSEATTLNELVVAWIRLIFEVAHLFVIFAIQFTAFSVMVLWLCQFLFTAIFADTLELSFLKRIYRKL